MAKQTETIDKNQFIAAILNNPSLGVKDREKVLTLLTRDIETDIKAGIRDLVREELSSATDATKKDDKSSAKGHWEHSPRKVNSFLMSFSSDKSVLKYTVHAWDAGDFDGWNYESFLSKVRVALKQNEVFQNLYWYNSALYYALYDYLLTFKKERDKYHWDKESRIKIGLQYPSRRALEWMKNNPGQQIWAMPLSEFPESYQPVGLFDNEELANMGDVRDVFKHVIEFRSDKSDFYNLIRSVFSNADFNVELDRQRLRSISFYTYTTAIRNALSRVVENICPRTTETANTVRISIQGETAETFELHILHVGSETNRTINDVRLRQGTFASMRCFNKSGSLLSICEYSVVGRFAESDGKSATYRIDYLYPNVEPDKDGNPAIRVQRLEESIEGFEYIFTFYKNA